VSPRCRRALRGPSPLITLPSWCCPSVPAYFSVTRYDPFIIIIIDNRGLNARWCLTPSLLSLPTAAYLGQRGLTPGYGQKADLQMSQSIMLYLTLIYFFNHLSVLFLTLTVILILMLTFCSTLTQHRTSAIEHCKWNQEFKMSQHKFLYFYKNFQKLHRFTIALILAVFTVQIRYY